jgi:ribokinase
MKVLNLGSLNIDHVYQLPHLVRAGETISSGAYHKNAGGKGLNQSIALARAGADVYHAGAVGEDGAFLRALLERAQVHTELLETLDAPTGHAVIQVDAAGQNCIILYAGANAMISEAMIDRVLARFDAGDALLVQNEVSNLAYMLEKGAQRGLCVVLNPSPITPALKSAPLEYADWMILNEIEGGELTGETETEKMLDALEAKYPRTQFVLTLGEKGAVYAGGGRRIAQAAYPTRAVDTTAAGDTFTGFFMAALLRGERVEDALKKASMASSLAVGRPGAGESIPAREEVEAALAKR